jgi:Cna protein B-type domain.
VPKAQVTVTESNTGFSRTTQTNESGRYSFPDLPPGQYTVAAELAGFKRASRAGVDVLVNTSPRVDLTLQPGNVSETINVTAETPILQTERADTGRKIEEVQLGNLPVSSGRNFQNFIKLVPGATAPVPSTFRIFQSAEQPGHAGQRAVSPRQQSSIRRRRQQRAHRLAFGVDSATRSPADGGRIHQ